MERSACHYYSGDVAACLMAGSSVSSCSSNNSTFARQRQPSYSFSRTGAAKQGPEFWVQLQKSSSCGGLVSQGGFAFQPAPRRPRGGTPSKSIGPPEPRWPTQDVVPGDMLAFVRKRAREVRGASAPGVKYAVVLVESLWKPDSFSLPAHGKGENYISRTQSVQEALRNKPVIFASVNPSGQNKKSMLWDRYSSQEELVPSNRSHKRAAPSRIGAFEVHLVQNKWDPERRCPVTLQQKDFTSLQHAGPPVEVLGPEGCRFVCAACAAAARGEPRPPPNSFSEQVMDEQHTLLHSKLWSRHWPNISQLMRKIFIVLCPRPPSGPCPIMDLELILVPDKTDPVEVPSHPVEESLKDLSGFDCPEQLDWFILGDPLLESRDGINKMTKVQVADALEKHGLHHRDRFFRFVEAEQSGGGFGPPRTVSVREFLYKFVSWDDVVSQIVAKRTAKIERVRRLNDEADEAYREGCEAFCEYAGFLARSVPGTPEVNVGTNDVDEMSSAMLAAHQLNEERIEAWGQFREEFDRWGVTLAACSGADADTRAACEAIAKSVEVEEQLRQRAFDAQTTIAQAQERAERCRTAALACKGC